MSRYGLVYLIGFLLLLWRLKRQGHLDYALYASACAAIGAIVGGRAGYVIFYECSYYQQHLCKILLLHKGGMSFHGGLAGTAAALYLAHPRDF